MRKIIAALSASLVLVLGIAPAQASTDPTIVIIDSGFNLSQISNNVVQEVCITAFSGCNNGLNFEIGTGSAQTNIAIAPRFRSDWNHGTTMALSAIAVNPNIKLIVIRNARVYSSGNVLFGNQTSLESALQWVLDNKQQYNIAGVLMARGSNSHSMANTASRGFMIQAQIYSTQLEKMQSNPSLFRASIVKFSRLLNDVRTNLAALPDIACPASTLVASLVSQLQTNNVATIFATGNDYNNRYVDSPACLDQAVSVTAANADRKILQLANVAPNTDFAVLAPNTSVASATLAGKWSLLYNGSYNSTYALLSSNGTNSGSWNTLFIP